jgi:hypothetical protein
MSGLAAISAAVVLPYYRLLICYPNRAMMIHGLAAHYGW